MKRCPECKRDHYDDTLLYCLEDGNPLLAGPASIDEPQTAVLHSTGAQGDVPAFESMKIAKLTETGNSGNAAISSDGTYVLHVKDDGGPPKQLTNFTSDQIAWFDLYRNGKPNLFSRGTTYKDVVLISGFTK
jgi:hypothetical protein